MRKIFILVVMVFSLYANKDGGPYISLGITNGVLDGNDVYHLIQDNDTSYKVAVGAYINKYFSVEAEYDTSFKFKLDDNRDFDLSVIDINVQAHYPFYHDMFDVNAKFGAGEINGSGSGSCFVYGIGASYRYNEMFSVKVGYDYVDIGVDLNANNSADSNINLGVSYIAFEVLF